jgi:hypothetical protein
VSTSPLEVIFVSNYIIASISARILSATLSEWHFWISTPISLILSNSSYVVCIVSIHKPIVTTLRLTTRLAAADIRESCALKPSATTANPTPAPPIPNGLEQMDVENEDRDDTNTFEAAASTITISPLVAQIIAPSAIQDSEAHAPPNPVSPHVEVAPLRDETNDSSGVIQDSEACTPPNPASPHIDAAPLRDVSNNPSTAERTAEEPPARTPPRLSRKDNNSSTSFASSPSLAGDTFFTSNSPAITSTVGTDTAPPGRPKPRPAYKSAVVARAAAEAAVAAIKVTTIADIESPPHRSPSPSPPPNLDLSLARTLPAAARNLSVNDPPGIEENEQTGRRKRKLTSFGLQHAKEIEEKLEKAAARKKATKKVEEKRINAKTGKGKKKSAK